MRASLAALVASLIALGACNDPTAAKPLCPPGGGVSITKFRATRINSLDLLLVVDNSSSMADKQAELARDLPEMIAALTRVPDPKTSTIKPFLDVHVGVITSSLGSHGTSACALSITNKNNDDRGHLLPRTGEALGAGCPMPVTASPLSWAFNPVSARSPTYKGEAGAAQLAAATACVVASAKEQGCGYEETWEAMYHFLIDPAPYAKAEVTCTFGVSGDACGSNKIEISGVDEELLAQRKAFLRPDSVLAVLILSDENDASLKPAGLNWLPWGYGKGKMMRGWAGCESVPDDFEPETAADFNRLHSEFNCWSCFENTGDPNCTLPWASDPLNGDVDGRNLRALRQTNRFGYNFLWGRQRYVDAFTKAQVFGSDNKLAPNPVFSGGFRTQDLVVVETVVGVPRSLVENADGTLKVALTSADWDLIQGPIGKRDPHMIESIAPRAGIPKFAGDRTVDPVHGGERDIADGDDLQYACIAKRIASPINNDCEGVDAHVRNPLCEPGNTQTHFKAYPGLRHLRIAKDLGISGLVASICSDSYRAVIRGMTDKLKSALNADCMRTLLVPDAQGSVNCMLVESLADGADEGRSCEALGKGLCTPGAAPCRREGSDYPPISVEDAAKQLNLPVTVVASDGSGRPVLTQAVVSNGNVYVIGNDSPTPRKHLVCELAQFTGPELVACANEEAFAVDPAVSGGYCYSQSPQIVAPQCVKLGAPGTIRFFGAATPRPGSELFTYCNGAKPSEPGCTP